MDGYKEYKEKLGDLLGKMSRYEASFIDWVEYWKMRETEPESSETVDLNDNVIGDKSVTTQDKIQ